MPWDYAILLDGAWRVIHGQVPHRDFYAPIGAVPLLVYSAGMKIAGTADALAWGSAILALFLFAIAWYVARCRLPGPAAFAFTVMTGLLVLAPRSLGFPPTHTSYAMHYNRIGWALVNLAVLLFLPRRDASAGGERGWRRYRGDAFLAGVICGLLAFVKINYFLAALCIEAAFVLTNRSRLTAVGAFAAGFAASVTLVLGYLRFDIAAFFRDVSMVAENASGSGAAQGAIDRIRRITDTGWHSADVLSLAAASLWLIWRTGGDRRTLCRVIVPAAAIIPFGFLICSTNQQASDIPLIAVAMLITAQLFERSSGPAARGTQGAVSLLALLATAWIAVPDFVSVGYAFEWNATAKLELAAEDRIQSAVMQSMSLPRQPSEAAEGVEETWRHYFARPRDEGATPHQYLQILNSGIALLRSHVGRGTRVVCLDTENPFPFALQLPPARGGALYWHYGLGFTETAHPDPEDTLKDADLVIVAKNTNLENLNRILALFAEPLARSFRLIDENESFRLYARK